MARALPLKEVLKSHVTEGELYEAHPDESVTCFACGHRCLIRDGRDGICRVRYNEDGKLYVPANYAAAIHCDPTEKKPFYHVLPGSRALTFGMLGCDFHCSYCQNWVTSQALRDPDAVTNPTSITASGLVEAGVSGGASLVVSSYNEPLITSEWAVSVFQLAHKAGFLTGYVSNGNATPEVLDYIRPHTNLYKVDLKGFDDRKYRKLGGVLGHVLKTIEMVHERGFWLEIVTLVIPGFNDSVSELKGIARFIAGVSPDIPWHVTAFHPDYRMRDQDNTGAATLIRAAEIGYEAGLHFVYAGNLPGKTGRFENTRCPGCGEDVITRFGFHVLSNKIRGGKCPSCEHKIPGIWNDLSDN